jgi:hypothetical protein
VNFAKFRASPPPFFLFVVNHFELAPASRELSFLDRLGLLVDQQWTLRENQALARRLHAACTPLSSRAPWWKISTIARRAGWTKA